MESFPEMTNKVTTLVRATGIEDPGRMSAAATERPDPEVPARARRRTFTARYKLENLAAYDTTPDGEKGALLRREGLYSSHIVQWRRARDAGALAGLVDTRPNDTRRGKHCDPRIDRALVHDGGQCAPRRPQRRHFGVRAGYRARSQAAFEQRSRW
ncbi:hypothetical protein [Mycobacterium sp.]|uniref:hypothetical protein n=1 Tax=Mycobacterium sp. TaxID=1785 RepID=UPI003C752450